ncbi:MAG: CDP-alcohol phosphatidyltransferase family protein, partial [Candidatus Binatia bacterium]
MQRPLRRHAADLLTAMRVLLTPVFVWLVCQSAGSPSLGVWAGTVFGVIAVSDVVDGRLARRWGSASSAGRTFDHLADITFIVSALSAYAFLRIAPWWVPAAIAASCAFMMPVATP